ncbi:outer membrane beta-barrel protein [Ningiella sp. W23]|uniref:outer membrane beta-barrel protein n=1 Tax=Ningiella sp. W23 TaxID=3023715 RepID=UPI0037584AEB
MKGLVQQAKNASSIDVFSRTSTSIMNTSTLKASAISLGLCLGMLASSTAYAQEQGVEFGAEARVVFDDNIFREVDGESDTIFEVLPTIGYVGLYGKHKLTAEYDGKYALYTDNSDVNYANHRARGQLDLDLTTRWNARLGVLVIDEVEEPGLNNFQLNGAEEFTEFDSVRLSAETSYGQRQSAGQFVFKYANQSFDYENNNQAFRDRTIDELTGTFFWRVFPRSRVIFEVRSLMSDSDNIVGFNQSFDQLSYLTGLTWEATAKTEGEFRIGYQNTEYDNPLIDDLDGLSFFLDVDYKPDSDSLANLAISRTTRDSAELTLAGLETTDIVLSYKTPLAGRFAMEAEYLYRLDDFDGASNRSDDTNRIKGQLLYDAYNWLEAYVGVEYLTRSSDLEIFEYDNTRFLIGVEILFDN